MNSLIEFNRNRLNGSYIFIVGSNSFFKFTDGEINIFTKNENEFDVYTYKGNINTGLGEFIISYKNPYQSLSVIENTSLTVTDRLSIINSSVEIYGTLKMKQGSSINIDNGLIKFNSRSVIDLTEPGISLNLNSSRVRINGKIVISYNNLSILNNKSIVINPSCELIVTGIKYPDRIYSATDYELSLRDKIINPHTNGEYNTEYGRIGYTWSDGDLKIKSQILSINILYGEFVLGDFKFRALGLQSKLVKDRQFISDIYVNKNATLYISEYFKGFNYYNPELYLGSVLFNFKRSAICHIDGTVIVDGSNAKISIDVESSIRINKGGKLILRNNGRLINSNVYNKNKCIYIYGELIIDNIEQLESFFDTNFVFGESGKLTILNPPTQNRKVLLSIPNGIKSSYLYQLFKSNLKHIEFHISKNNGIKIDKNFEYFNKQLIDWYDGIRIEKAIFNKQIVWHDEGFIDIDSSIISWASLSCSLYDASKIFKSTKYDKKEMLQEVVENLLYAGCGDIVFRFIDNDNYKEIKLILKPIKVENIYNKPLTKSYVIECTDDADLFIKNKIGKTSSSNIVSETSKHVSILKGKTEFEL